jgi:hypothetical protein
MMAEAGSEKRAEARLERRPIRIPPAEAEGKAEPAEAG